jgi:DNA-binding NarL/FixJ family response regulator
VVTDGLVNEQVRSVIHGLKRASGLPVVFGGAVSSKSKDIRIDSVAGGATDLLAGLRIGAGSGLGGRVVVTAKPHYVPDYLSDDRISHEYDRPVAAEGLRAIAAAPLVVNDTVLAVVYAGVRGISPYGDRVMEALQRAVLRAGIDLAVRLELDRRQAELEAIGSWISARSAVPRHLDSKAWREVRDELRTLTEEVENAELRRRFAAVCARLGADTVSARSEHQLSPREVDVLNLVAVGYSNKETGSGLGLTTETVKSYLRSASRKLGTHNRIESVARARSAGLIP